MIKTLFELCFLFFLYSFTGWILEVIQAAFNQKRFVNRGFINSPLCISYGIGAVIITINTHEMTGLATTPGKRRTPLQYAYSPCRPASVRAPAPSAAG